MRRLGELGRALREGMEEAPRGRPAQEGWSLALADVVLDIASGGGRSEVAAALEAGLAELERRTDTVRLVATGIEWLGGGVAAVERTMASMVASAQREIVMTAYSMTPGGGRVWAEVEKAFATGVRGVILVDRLDQQHQDVRAMLARLAAKYRPRVGLYDFVPAEDRDGLHAKVLVVDREIALVGSANLSHRGLVTAHELSVVVEGPTAGRIVEQVERLLRSPAIRQI